MKKILIIISLFLLGAAPNDGRRYISLAPSTTEILFALGLDEEIVGVSSFCNYPEKAKTKEQVGTFSQPNIEKIVFLKPDYIFCTGLEQNTTIQKLNQLKLNTYVADPTNTEELLNTIREIGKLTGRQKQAGELTAKMNCDIDAASSLSGKVAMKKRPKVFLEFWNNPLMTAGKGSFIDELITLAGGVNIAGDLNRSYGYFSPEEVIRRNPDCIIVAYMVNDEPAKELSRRPGWDKVSAVKNKRVYADINPDIMLRPGPRFAQGVKELHQRLYQQ